MTVDEVFAKLKADHGADIQSALDWQQGDGGEVVFNVSIDRQPKAQLEAEAKAEAMKPENLLAQLEALKSNISTVAEASGVVLADPVELTK